MDIPNEFIQEFESMMVFGGCEHDHSPKFRASNAHIK